MAGPPPPISWVINTGNAARRRAPLFDHIVRTQDRYNQAQGAINAGGIGYYGFLSFFPLMALALFVVGRIAEIYPRARDGLTSGITAAFPGIIGTGDHQISLEDVQRLAATLGWIGLAGALLTGLGWMSAMRTALLDVFDVPQDAKPDFFFGKIRDVVTLPVLGLTLAVSVGLSSLVARFSTQLLEWLELSEGLAPLLRVLSVLVGVATSTLLFWAMYVLLGRPRTPRRSLWQGALLAAFAFEILKFLAAWLLGHTAGQPAFQIFGIALIVVIWINYFARIALYGAAWAHTTRRARNRRAAAAEAVEPAAAPTGEAAKVPEAPAPGDTDALRRRVEAARADPERRREIAAAAVGEPDVEAPLPRRTSTLPAFVAGAGSALAVVALLRRRSGGRGRASR